MMGLQEAIAIAGIIAGVITALKGIQEYREYDADIASAIITGKPKALQSALRKSVFLKINFKQMLQLGLSFYIPKEKNEKEALSWNSLLKPVWSIKWSDILHPIPIYHPSIASRIKLLSLVDNMLNDYISIELLKDPNKIRPIRTFLPNFLLLWTPIGRGIRALENKKLNLIFSYIRSNKVINLKKFAKDLGIAEIDITYVLLGLLITNFIKINYPPFR